MKKLLTIASLALGLAIGLNSCMDAADEIKPDMSVTTANGGDSGPGMPPPPPPPPPSNE